MLVQRELRRRLRAEPSSIRFEPCLPRLALRPPAGADWIHEIKHDGFRILAQRDASRVRLSTRNGYDFSERFPLIVAAIEALPARSCAIDGEAIACDENGLSVFDMIRWRQHDRAVTLCAFDLIELDGEDIRQKAIEKRKQLLAKLLRARPAILSRCLRPCWRRRSASATRSSEISSAGMATVCTWQRIILRPPSPRHAGWHRLRPDPKAPFGRMLATKTVVHVADLAAERGLH